MLLKEAKRDKLNIASVTVLSTFISFTLSRVNYMILATIHDTPHVPVP